jgi:hypothetical protein
MGLKKFDPFTLAVYHTLVQGGYLVAVIGLLNIRLTNYDLNTNSYIFSLLAAFILIGINFYLIKGVGIERLTKFFGEESRFVKGALDVLMICYVIFVFVLINYTRDLHTP